MKAKVKIGYYIDVHEFQDTESSSGYPKYAGDDPKAAITLFEKEFEQHDAALRQGNVVVQLYYQSENGEVAQQTRWIRQSRLGSGQVEDAQ